MYIDTFAFIFVILFDDEEEGDLKKNTQRLGLDGDSHLASFIASHCPVAGSGRASHLEAYGYGHMDMLDLS